MHPLTADVPSFLNRPWFTIAGTPVSPMTIVAFALIVLVTFWLSRLAQRGTTRALEYRGVTDRGTIGLVSRIVSYVIVLLGLGMGLQTMGVNLGALLAASAFFAVALGFAMQNVAQNFVSGIILLTERTIKPGDVLQVNDRVVRVTRMGLRATVARSRDEEDLIVPNATLVQNTVTNFTLRDPTYRLRVAVGVAYESDLAQVQRVLLDVASSFPARLADRDPRVLLTDFADSSVTFEVLIWNDDPWTARTTQSELRLAIWSAFQREGIVIAYPQLDVHLPPGAQVVAPPASGGS